MREKEEKGTGHDGPMGMVGVNRGKEDSTFNLAKVKASQNRE